MSSNKRLFVSAVSSEFRAYRIVLSADLKRPNLDVSVQEDFGVLGATTLEKLDRYIEDCDGVVHLIGKSTGAVVEALAVTALFRRYTDFARRLPPLADYQSNGEYTFSYTQWEAYLAIYHRRPLFIYRACDFERPTLEVPRDPAFVHDIGQEESQKDHYARIRALGVDRGEFKSPDDLSKSVLRDLVEILPRLESTACQFNISLMPKFTGKELIGRDEELDLLDSVWAKVKKGEAKHPCVLTFVALGGEGKTSLVAKWAATLAPDWPGCDAAFAWSFYNQGTGERQAPSSDLFLKKALDFFGDDEDKELAASNAGAYEKGQRLARVVGQRRCLLILDGLEPLQYAPSSPTPGQLKDQGVAALLKGLATSNQGLCVITTRFSIPDLSAFWHTTAQEVMLLRLSLTAGVHLLESFKIYGRAEQFEALVEEVKGHALTLTLLGSFLSRAFHGDIRQRDRIKFEKADEKFDGGHAFRIMANYEEWLLGDGGEEGRREVTVLRLMGLFDRPADAGCLQALRRETIPALTESLAELADDDWEFCLSGLEAARLLTVNRDGSGALVSLDAHPHLREYFARQLREQHGEAWRAAHRRLYEFLSANTDEPKPTVQDLQPLYQAVAHGCHAGMQREAWEVYFGRILRGTQFYSTDKLGTMASDLGALSCFFENGWNRPSTALGKADLGWLLNETGYCLLSLGRVSEAVDPILAAVANAIDLKDWLNAALRRETLSRLRLSLGFVAKSIEDATSSIEYSQKSGDLFYQAVTHGMLGEALLQAGRRDESIEKLQQSDKIQSERELSCRMSLRNFRFCDRLLVLSETAAWRNFLGFVTPDVNVQSYIEECQAALRRTRERLPLILEYNSLVSIALDHLTLGRIALYAKILGGLELGNASSEIEESVYGLRRAADMTHLPRALLSRAWLRTLLGTRTGFTGAQEDLNEAWEIAERGPMRLHMADINLYRARLFFRENDYPFANWDRWQTDKSGPPRPRTAADDLAAAEKLIYECGYHRRGEELADAKKAIQGA